MLFCMSAISLFIHYNLNWHNSVASVRGRGDVVSNSVGIKNQTPDELQSTLAQTRISNAVSLRWSLLLINFCAKPRLSSLSV
jgi:hypothetical protein